MRLDVAHHSGRLLHRVADARAAVWIVAIDVGEQQLPEAGGGGAARDLPVSELVVDRGPLRRIARACAVRVVRAPDLAVGLAAQDVLEAGRLRPRLRNARDTRGLAEQRDLLGRAQNRN